ncbi:MAG: cation:proton antiporter [Candidatus Altiarchaeota archaeon]|nr:cation:proton antiporter [Candidatus Altiarchaeota archaeon]
MDIVGIEGSLLLLDIGYVILSATILAIIARALKQPLIVAYVLAGIIIGPVGMGLITEKEVINVLAEFGIALLLFMVGLELDFRRLKDVGKVSLTCGLGQIIITFIAGFLLAKYLLIDMNGYSDLWAFYVALALTISSTMIVVKLLSDMNELDTLHGKIVLGTLLVQDIVSIIVLASLSSLEGFSPVDIISPMLNGVALVSIAVVSAKYVGPQLLRYVSKSTEILFLFALSWCLIFSFISLKMGFETVTIGAFLGGVSLAIFPYNLEVIGRVKSLRDFFATIFFVSLGMQITFDPKLLPLGLILSAFVLFGNVIIVMLINLLSGFRKRTSFLAAISLAQISEFSLIIVGNGVRLKHIPESMLSLVTIIAVVTITVSSYFIVHGTGLYKKMIPFLNLIERIGDRKIRELEKIPKKSRNHIILCGCHSMGKIILETMKDMKKNYLVVDINPEVVKKLIDEGVPCIYGDVGDKEILERIDLKDAEIVISTIPNHEDNLLLIREVKKSNPETLVFISEREVSNALELYSEGADYVIIPDIVSGEIISEYMTEYMTDIKGIKKARKKHIKKLEDIKREEKLGGYEYSILKELERNARLNHLNKKKRL